MYTPIQDGDRVYHWQKESILVSPVDLVLPWPLKVLVVDGYKEDGEDKELVVVTDSDASEIIKHQCSFQKGNILI
jgi:hypothetical protein